MKARMVLEHGEFVLDHDEFACIEHRKLLCLMVLVDEFDNCLSVSDN